MIETRLLRQFIAVAEELNFRRAAERLHMAQPPLSQAILRLEDQLGYAVFERSNRKVSLTAAGTAFLATARQVLATWKRAWPKRGAWRRAAPGTCAWVLSRSAPYAHVLDALRQFRLDFPDVHLTLREASTQELVELAGSGPARYRPAARAGAQHAGADVRALVRRSDHGGAAGRPSAGGAAGGGLVRVAGRRFCRLAARPGPGLSRPAGQPVPACRFRAAGGAAGAAPANGGRPGGGRLWRGAAAGQPGGHAAGRRRHAALAHRCARTVDPARPVHGVECTQALPVRERLLAQLRLSAGEQQDF